MSQGGVGALESSTVGTACITYGTTCKPGLSLSSPTIDPVKFHMRLAGEGCGEEAEEQEWSQALGCFSSRLPCALRPVQPLAQAEPTGPWSAAVHTQLCMVDQMTPTSRWVAQVSQQLVTHSYIHFS